MPLKKQCNRCKNEKPVSLFYANKRMKDGVNTFCIECHKADNLQRKQKNRANTEFKAAENAKTAQRRSANKERYNKLTKEWRTRNVEHLRTYGQAYRAQHQGLINFLCQKRKIALQQRTPLWLSEDDFWMIEQAYDIAAARTKLTGISWHVDHVIPLRGKTVSGLHTPLNLRVIPASENQRKSNTFEVQHAA
jgi:hypothetical protein